MAIGCLSRRHSWAVAGACPSTLIHPLLTRRVEVSRCDAVAASGSGLPACPSAMGHPPDVLHESAAERGERLGKPLHHAGYRGALGMARSIGG